MEKVKLIKVVAIVQDGSARSLCGACREYMMQLDKDSSEIEILIDYKTRKTVRLKYLIPINSLQCVQSGIIRLYK